MKGGGRNWKGGNVEIGNEGKGEGNEMAMGVIGREEVVVGAGAVLVLEWGNLYNCRFHLCLDLHLE
jgi:hypothetical protein